MEVNRTIGIEIMPVEKSCEQGCAHCPLSSKNKPITAQEIDERVQTTFYTLENKIKADGKRYDIHCSSKLELFPTLQYPDLLDMARFETNKNISTPGNAEIFVDNIKRTIEQNKLNPKHLCFSIVPKSLTIDALEMELIATIMRQLSGGFFDTQRQKKVSCTVRSNFVPEKKFLIDELSDKEMLKEVIKTLTAKGSFDEILTENHYEDDEYVKLYGALARSKDMHGNEYQISNRVILHKKITQDVMENFLKTGDGTYDYRQIQTLRHLKFGASFLIAPQGVMFTHTSDAINNPTRWVSHQDFANILDAYGHKNLEEIYREIMIQNITVYGAIMENLKDQYQYTMKNIPFEEYLPVLERLRPQFFFKGK